MKFVDGFPGCARFTFNVWDVDIRYTLRFILLINFIL